MSLTNTLQCTTGKMTDMDIVVTKAGDRNFKLTIPNVMVPSIEIPFRKQDIEDQDVWANVGPAQFEGVSHPVSVGLLAVHFEDQSMTVVRFAEEVALEVGDHLRFEAGMLMIAVPPA